MRNTADLTGTTAAAVGALLKANSGNPLYAQSFDPLVIGATLEVTGICSYDVFINNSSQRVIFIDIDVFCRLSRLFCTGLEHIVCFQILQEQQ